MTPCEHRDHRDWSGVFALALGDLDIGVSYPDVRALDLGEMDMESISGSSLSDLIR